MADLPTRYTPKRIRTPQVEAPMDVVKLWHQSEIQSRRGQIARLKQDIEDLLKGKIPDLQAKIRMLELEIVELENDLKDFEPGRVIDVTNA